MRPVALSAVLLMMTACLPEIHVPDGARFAVAPRAARSVELCVLYGERFERPLYQGVDELSMAPWHYAIGSIVVKHPAGLVIIDPAFGRTIARDLERAGPVFSLLGGDGSTKTPLVESMSRAGLDPADVRFALPTHLHWDHIGALRDLPNAKVLINKPELEAARMLHRVVDDGVMPHHLAPVHPRISTYELKAPGVEGFDSSFDFFGDGAIVAVPLPGHTVGSVGLFVRSGEKTYFFSGDTTWTMRGVEKPAHKNPLVPIDGDLDTLSDTIGALHALFKTRTDVVVVPAHDGSQLGLLPECGK